MVKRRKRKEKKPTRIPPPPPASYSLRIGLKGASEKVKTRINKNDIFPFQMRS